MQGYLLVFVGGGLGAALRHGVNVASVRLLGVAFPYGTLTVNVVGCTVMGLLAAWFAQRGGTAMGWRLFLTTGVLGGFTTFSAFSLDVALLMERNELATAAFYVMASVFGSIAGLFLGLAVMRASLA